MNRKLIATIAAAFVVAVSVILHFFTFADSATSELENSSELRLIIGTCMPTVYDPDSIQRELRRTLKMSEDAEELRKHWDAQSESK